MSSMFGLALQKFWIVLAVALAGGGSSSLDNRAFFPRVDYEFFPFTRPFGLVAEDFNGDLVPDLVTTVAGGLEGEKLMIVMFANDGAGGFAMQEPVQLELPPVDVAAADLDRDGDLDLAVALYDLPGGVAILENRDGRFVLLETLTAGNRPSAIACVDVDRDGLPDIVATNFGGGLCANDGRAAVLRNQGGFTFGSPMLYPVGCNPWDIATGDLDGVNGPDLVIANDQSTSVSILLNDGSGGFGPETQYYVGVPRDVKCCDVDHDGNVDIVLGTAYSSVFVLWGRGNGRFGQGSRLAAGSSAVTVACGDVDGNGLTDIVAANGDASAIVRVLLNQGERTFTTQDIGATDIDPRNIVLANLDPGRSGLDIATANSNSRTVSVLLNQGVETPLALCGRGGVDAVCSRATDVLTVNGSTGGADRSIQVTAATSLTASIKEAPARRGDGQPTKACLYAWLGQPSPPDVVVLRQRIGRMCFGPASIATKPPHRIWNAIGSVATLGADNAPGPIPVIPDSGNFQFFSLPGGIGQSLQVTFQGIIEDPCSRGAIPYSITNAVLLQVD